jgi:cell division protein FtsI (penicillin-binding protein 3)
MGWLAASLGVFLKAGKIQVLERDHWRAAAEGQQEELVKIPAPRGAILDRNGDPIAASHETFRVSVAPGELPEALRAETVARLAAELDLPRTTRRRVADPGNKWVVVPGRYPPLTQEALRSIPGVYFEKELKRYYPRGTLAQGVLGTVHDGTGKGGIEGRFEDHLRGTPGEEVQARDNEGRPIPGQAYPLAAPRPGGQVTLTLHRDIQEIGHAALTRAIEETGARGGDLLISDPKTGEILALVSIQDGNAAALSAINTPYEPGSTLKPFTVAGILMNGVGALGDSIDTEGGVWRVEGRTIRDVHVGGKVTLADALRFSSNVGVAKAAQALDHAQQYEILRDFGFGSLSGIGLAGEVEGILRRPPNWSRQSPASLAIGYEIGVTPIQMVMAYGALANGGRLMEPLLVKDLRDPEGRVIQRFQPRVVRQVIPPALARELSEVLEGVVEDGTGTGAKLGAIPVAGKSGTTRAYQARGGYEPGEYFSSFICFLPVEKPQLVVYVKLDRPEGAYYGGAAAAPVTRATMEAVLAARQAPIDREALASLTRRQPISPPFAGAQFASNDLTSNPPARASRALNLPEAGAAVPDVSGLSPRLAVRRLHARGFRVILESPGPVTGSDPAPGTALAPGDTVRILVGRSGDG